MDGFGEMIGQEERRDAVAGLVVHQDGAKQGLFRLKVLGRGAEGIIWPVGYRRSGGLLEWPWLKG